MHTPAEKRRVSAIRRPDMSNDEAKPLLYFVVLGLGRDNDHALAIVQTNGDPGWSPCNVTLCRKLDDTYAIVARNVRDLMSTPPMDERAVLILDTTVVGRPIVDRFRDYLAKYNLQVVKITNDDVESYDQDLDVRWVPKIDVVDSVRLLSQSDRLRYSIGTDDNAKTLENALENFQLGTEDLVSGNYNLWREGENGDRALAVALACWAAIHPAFSQPDNQGE
jgi:hypothetical protein